MEVLSACRQMRRKEQNCAFGLKKEEI